MNPEIKAEWLAALRSGEYQQGKSHLKRADDDSKTLRYCCLGVLCELAIKAGVGEWYEDEGKYAWRLGRNALYSDYEAAFLPNAVRVWSGMWTEDGSLNNEYLVPQNDGGTVFARRLTSANDSGLNFQQIADIIEAEF